MTVRYLAMAEEIETIREFLLNGFLDISWTFIELCEYKPDLIKKIGYKYFESVDDFDIRTYFLSAYEEGHILAAFRGLEIFFETTSYDLKKKRDLLKFLIYDLSNNKNDTYFHILMKYYLNLK